MKKSLIIAMLAVVSLSAVPSASAAVNVGEAVKGSGPTVYYVTGDRQRVAFLDEQTYRTWYPDFSAVRTVSDAELAKLPFAGVAPLRPGIRPVKGASESRVYAIDRDGALRWLAGESVARVIYGDDWNRKVAVLPDAALAEYGRGSAVTGPDQYWWKAERDASADLQDVRVRRIAAAMFAAPKPASVASLAFTAAPKSQTRIIILPTVINDNGGSAKEGDVDYFVGESLVMPQEGVNVMPGSYTLYHGKLPGYKISAWSGDCSPDGVVTVPADETRACFIVFDDVPDSIYGALSNRPPMLTISASVRNTRGGRLTDRDVQLFIGSMQVVSGFPSSIRADDYTLYRVVPPGYTASVWGGDCAAQGTVAVRNGEEKTCTITFHD
ncbi:MAG: hypothetical protein AAB554_01820 [Patescibacteria group bacterium]|mgnify:CR=1 FL=1